MLQDIMHNNSISVVEEPVFEAALSHTEPDPPLTPRTPTSERTHTPRNITLHSSYTVFTKPG